MDAKQLKALVEEYLVARHEFHGAPDDDCLDCAIDALDRADAIVCAIKPLLEGK